MKGNINYNIYIYIIAILFMVTIKLQLKHLGNVAMAAVSLSLITAPATAIEPIQAAEQVLSTEGDRAVAKKDLNSALKVARSKPAMAVATTIVCGAYIPIADACASPGICIACGILVAKTLG